MESLAALVAGIFIATITISGVANQDYVRSGEYVMRVPLARLNEGLKRANRLGQVTNVAVS